MSLQRGELTVIGVSVDSVYSHFAWKNTPVEEGGIGKLDTQLLQDLPKQISRDYDVF